MENGIRKIGEVGMKKLREDCYFYYESQEMSAHVPNCSFDAQYEYGFCPCSENCKHYISKNEAHNLIKQITRCKDCKYNDDGECIIKAGWFPVKPDWFCADGEHK